MRISTELLTPPSLFLFFKQIYKYGGILNKFIKYVVFFFQQIKNILVKDKNYTPKQITS